ncbi:MOSC domain-containing protein [Hymenobacter sp. H14-R3]|uniref:MOSC domain-containing protein n=1 Tax=Hymenobacter sp. H14-R3 TaxID=3046308 RepID=UPI0024BBC4D9|nr:MOSC domain-containing protein [Hymenobacter sp. H14-R3]MDJ0367220.1 MOSC domain-containing protein [Hymenobacter sp. H14-R3]
MAFPFFGDDKSTVARLLSTLPQQGRIEWIGLRAARRTEPIAVFEAEVLTDARLAGDHASLKPGGKRQLTLVQHEHLAAVAGFLGMTEPVAPGRLRRNLVVSGLNLLALKGRQIQLGEEVILDITGECHPCSRMEEELGPGGYNAMRGHGGLTAHIAQGGTIRVGDAVRVLPAAPAPEKEDNKKPAAKGSGLS